MISPKLVDVAEDRAHVIDQKSGRRLGSVNQYTHDVLGWNGRPVKTVTMWYAETAAYDEDGQEAGEWYIPGLHNTKESAMKALVKHHENMS